MTIPQLVFLLFTAALALPAYAVDLSEWLKNPPYVNGGTAQEQIRCYALPYGAIGFASHVLTYFTAFMLSRGRNPIFFWKRLSHRRFNLAVAVIGFLVTFPLTVLTMVRCRSTWGFILVAVWKLVLSVTLTSMTIHAARMIYDTPKPPKTAADTTPITDEAPPPYIHAWHGVNFTEYQRIQEAEAITNHPQYKQQFTRIWYWTIFYFLGAVLGFVGICNIVSKHLPSNQQLRIVTGVFGGLVLFIMLCVAVLCFCAMSGKTGCMGKLGFSVLVCGAVTVFVLTVLFAFYTDWALAALAGGDLIGRPGGENAAVYWAYFAAKRLPMVSF
ncbi:hypothetical protein MFIFM68171_06688 [Madurella fahalii]|uniref:Uncharacterized protein n=1 Tax=Madurella fahalii TaxID=1157608 RepID=A0ABQ0GFF6_9PEZI